MPKTLTAKEAVVKIAKRIRRERKFYSDMPEFQDDFFEDVALYAMSVLRRCGDVPLELRPKE